MINIVIDGINITCLEGENLLEVARKNNIQIPSICYLSKCSPTLACKMCMVIVNDKRMYACNTKLKDGMQVLTNEEELIKDRACIMETYCINHPLECGVCDKSGECELQDFTLYTKIQNQSFGLKDSKKRDLYFAQSYYDPNLCIMCERCATTCNDNIGEGFLKASKFDLESPAHLKEVMAKDPFSVLAKKQKGLISFTGSYLCKDCGECISACPVGAMGYKDFSYKSNAWELEKIYNACSFCSCGCELIYNTKYANTQNSHEKIYRVQNDYHFNPICGAGRFCFDLKSIASPKEDLPLALEAFLKADSINIGGSTSNEEIFLLQLIAKKLNLNLLNPEAYRFQSFRNDLFNALNLLQVSLESRLASFEDFSSTKHFLSLNSFLKQDAPLVRYRLNNALKLNKSSLTYCCSIKDLLLDSLSKQVGYVKTSLNDTLLCIYGILLANDLFSSFKQSYSLSLDEEQLNNIFLEKQISLDSFKLKESNIIFISYATLEERIDSKELFSNSVFIYALAFLLSRTNTKICYIPKGANIIGIANLAYLSYKVESKYCIGFKADGDFVLDCILEGVDYDAFKSFYKKPDFSLPLFYQVDGSITSLENRLLCLNPVIDFKDFKAEVGCDFMDIASSLLDLKQQYLSQFTNRLYLDNKTYKNISYEDLALSINKDGVDNRGYRLDMSKFKDSLELTKLDLLDEALDLNPKSFNAILLDNQNQFSIATALSSNLQSKIGIYVSASYLESLNLKEADLVKIRHAFLQDELGLEWITCRIYIDYDLEQDVFLLPCLFAKALFGNKQSEIYTNIELKRFSQDFQNNIKASKEQTLELIRQV